MRNFWVKRGEWVIGPVTEHQIRAMAKQQWFRSNDQVGIAAEGPWTEARSVVPAKGFNSEHTVRRESLLEPAPPAASPPTGQSAETPRQVAAPQSRTRPASFAGSEEPSARSSDAPPAWFQSSRRSGHSDLSDLPGHKPDPWSNSDSGLLAEADDRVAGREVPNHSQPRKPVVASESSSTTKPQDRKPNNESLVDDMFGGAVPVSGESIETFGRFQTAEFDAGSVEFDGDRDADCAIRSEADSGRKTASGDWSFDLAAGLASTDDAEQPVEHSGEIAASLPDQLELDGDEPARKPVTDWELVIDDLKLDEEDDGEQAGCVAQSVAPFALSVHSLKTGQALSAAESAASAELDFARLANLAAGDPALSRSELPAAPAEGAPPSLMTPEERALRRTIGSDSFQTQLSILCLTIGLQSCALSAIINGLGFVALRRFFLLSTEVFFPWGTGSLEVLEGADLALAGTAMAVTFSLPFLALSYLIRVDGRVLYYLISLGVALMPAIVIGGGGLNAVAGTIFACLLLAVPAVVSAVLCGMLAMKSSEETLKQLLAAAAGVGVLVAVSVAFAAPVFSIEYLLRELPPELRLGGGLIYVVLLFYSAQLTLVYFVLARIAEACLDESTQGFVDQHMVFHWLLTMTAFMLIGAVHAQMATGWGTAPVLLGGLTAVVSLGFNLWSLVGHLEPRLDRLRVDD